METVILYLIIPALIGYVVGKIVGIIWEHKQWSYFSGVIVGVISAVGLCEMYLQFVPFLQNFVVNGVTYLMIHR